MSQESIANILEKYIPGAAVDICSNWIVNYNVHVRITRSRATKFGDYRRLKESGAHQITINHDLNQYSFLITFVHEIAHLHAEEKYNKGIAPHGTEWKNEFSKLLDYFIQLGVFPPDLVGALTSYVKNPAASSCSDHDLLRALRKYDKKESLHVQHLEDLPKQTLFRLHSSRSGLIFRKGEQIRTRFHCVELTTKREYYVNPLTEVVVHEIPVDGLQLKVSGM